MAAFVSVGTVNFAPQSALSAALNVMEIGSMAEPAAAAWSAAPIIGAGTLVTMISSTVNVPNVPSDWMRTAFSSCSSA